MSSRPPDNALLTIMGRPPGMNALPMVADVTRVAPRRAASAPRMDTMSAAPDDWWSNLTRRGARWAAEHKVADIREFPPIKLLTAILGDNPLESIEAGPGTAIASFARRNPQVMRRFADPGFENFIMKHGPYTPGHARTNSPRSLRDNAPEGVINDLWEQYTARPETQRFFESRRAADAERRARSVGEMLGRRASDK